MSVAGSEPQMLEGVSFRAWGSARKLSSEGIWGFLLRALVARQRPQEEH